MPTVKRVDPQAITQLESEIEAAFSIFDKRTFLGLLRSSLAGEYFGLGTYAAFELATANATERHFWEVTRKVEQTMIQGLETVLDRHGVARPDRETFVALGERAADVFDEEPHQGYCDWVRPLIDDGLAGFRKVAALSTDPNDKPILDELVAHEVAFGASWDLLPNGFAAAVGPLTAHLKTAESAQAVRSNNRGV